MRERVRTAFNVPNPETGLPITGFYYEKFDAAEMIRAAEINTPDNDTYHIIMSSYKGISVGFSKDRSSDGTLNYSLTFEAGDPAIRREVVQKFESQFGKRAGNITRWVSKYDPFSDHIDCFVWEITFN